VKLFAKIGNRRDKSFCLDHNAWLCDGHFSCLAQNQNYGQGFRENQSFTILFFLQGNKKNTKKATMIVAFNTITFKNLQNMNKEESNIIFFLLKEKIIFENAL
jgi:hypothetical protein